MRKKKILKASPFTRLIYPKRCFCRNEIC